jgi:hypothetical protein
MFTINKRAHAGASYAARVAAAVVGLIALSFGLASCSAVSKITTAVHDLTTGNAALNALTSKIKAGESLTYDATYETTGSSPSTIEIAAQPPSDFAYISPASNGSGASEIIESSAGSFSCTQNATASNTAYVQAASTGTGTTGTGTTGKPGTGATGATGTGTTGTTGATGSTGTKATGATGSSGTSAPGQWNCVKFSAADGASYADLFQAYTGAYVLDALQAYSGVAALVGVTIKSSTMTVNGFALSCIVVSSSSGSTGSTGNNSGGTWCVTQQGLLGYVSDSGDSSAFEIKSYSASPPASLFQAPAGATITTVPTGLSGTTGSGEANT